MGLVRSLDAAGSFVDEVGVALLFPAPGIELPSLWEAVAGPGRLPFDGGMGDAESKVWGWKDALPLEGLAWYGKFVRGRACLLAPDLLAALYPGEGTVEDHHSIELGDEAHHLAEILIDDALPSGTLRALVGRKPYEKGMTHLQRKLLTTNAGVYEQASGWPSAMIDLTCRRFEVGGRADPAYAAKRFMDAAPDATPAELARAFGWPISEARGHLPIGPQNP